MIVSWLSKVHVCMWIPRFLAKASSSLLPVTGDHWSKLLTLWGAWVAQSLKWPTLAQVMISPFMSSSPTSGSVLTAQSLEPALESVSPSLSVPSLLNLCLSVSQKWINVKKTIKIRKRTAASRRQMFSFSLDCYPEPWPMTLQSLPDTSWEGEQQRWIHWQ